MKQANNYNPKLDYLFCKYASSRSPLSKIDEEEWRDVYHELKKPNDPRQEKMLRFKRVLNFMKDPQCHFSMSTLLGCLTVYLGTSPKEDDIDYEKLNSVFSFKHPQEEMNFRDLFISIFLEKPFKDELNIVMAEIASNFLLIKQGKVPVIFYAFVVEKLLNLISSNEIEGAKLLMLNLLQRSEVLNRKHKFIPLDVLLKRIDEIKPVLQSTFGVTSLFYYGSYAKNVANEYSDFDLFVEVDPKRQEDEDNKYRIKGYLEKELSITVDCHVRDRGYVKSPLRVDMIRHLKLIF